MIQTITYDDTQYQLMPKGPTEEILNAMGDVDGTPDRLLRMMYLGALSASPTPPAQPAEKMLNQALTDPENQPNQYGAEFLMRGPKMAFKIGVQQFTLDYEPENEEEFNFMRDMLINAMSAFTPDVKVTFLARADQANTKDAIAQAVDRFLGWKLPHDFAPDCGISFDGRKDDEWNKNKTWPIGTNLFTAEQAKQMLEYVLSAHGIKGES